jgi:hypothetical protein
VVFTVLCQDELFTGFADIEQRYTIPLFDVREALGAGPVSTDEWNLASLTSTSRFDTGLAGPTNNAMRASGTPLSTSKFRLGTATCLVHPSV